MRPALAAQGHRSRVTGHGSQVTGHGSRVTGHMSQVTGHGSRVTGHGSQVTGHRSKNRSKKNAKLHDSFALFVVVCAQIVVACHWCGRFFTCEMPIFVYLSLFAFLYLCCEMPLFLSVSLSLGFVLDSRFQMLYFVLGCC